MAEDLSSARRVPLHSGIMPCRWSQAEVPKGLPHGPGGLWLKMFGSRGDFFANFQRWGIGDCTRQMEWVWQAFAGYGTNNLLGRAADV